MTLSQRLREYIAAAFTGIWVQSHEHPDALIEIAQLCRDQKWSLAVWDIDRGLQTNGQAVAGSTDPLAAIEKSKRQAEDLLGAFFNAMGWTVIIRWL